MFFFNEWELLKGKTGAANSEITEVEIENGNCKNCNRYSIVKKQYVSPVHNANSRNYESVYKRTGKGSQKGNTSLVHQLW
jgi:hypothetical protein